VSESSAAPAPTQRAVRIHQTHDASGTPAAAEFLEYLPAAPLLIKRGTAAMSFLRPMNPSRSDREFTYFYTDPARGSGWLELEGFGSQDAKRVQENVWMEEIERKVGQQPRRNADTHIPHALAPRFNNPWMFVAMGAMPFVLGAYILPRLNEQPATAVLAGVIVGVLMILGAVLAFVNLRKRVPWWHRARRYAREHGPMHPDLEVWS
jgi:hypothetical protein